MVITLHFMQKLKLLNESPNWAKGGSIGVLIAVIFMVFQFFFVPSFFYGNCGGISCLSSFAKFVMTFFTDTMFPLFSSPLAEPMLRSEGIYTISALLYYFVLGAFVGLMVDKIKNARK